MANITDTLITVLRIVGATEVAATLAAVGRAHSQFAQAVAASGGSFSSLLTAMAPTLGVILPIVAGILALKVAFDLVSRALHTFAEEQQKLFQTEVVFRNLGLGNALPQIRGAVDQASQRTTIQRPELLGAAERFAEVGLQPNQIRQALTVAADTAVAKGRSLSEVAQVIEKGVEGQTRGLKDYGITIQDTGSRAANFALIMQQLQLRFQGAGEAYKNTLPGALANLQNSIQHLFSTIGERLAPFVVKALNVMAAAVDWVAKKFEEFYQKFRPLIEILARLFHIDLNNNPASQVGRGGDRNTEYLRQIADNTKQQVDAIEERILGGSGEAVRGNFGWLHGRLAMAI